MGFDSARPWDGVAGAVAAGARPGGDSPPPWSASPRRRSSRVVGWLAALLLVGYGLMTWTASLRKGVSFDEGLQLGVGNNIWRNGDFRIEGANGDLIKRWATLPFLLTRPAAGDPSDAHGNPVSGYELGDELLFERGNEPESLLRQSRAMVALLGMATGLLVFRAARGLFGAGGGLVALTVFVFSPEMLAFGGVVSTDMSITFALFAGTWAIWRLLERVTWPRLALSLAAVSLPLLAKASGLVIIPVALVLVAARLALAEPLPVEWRGRVWRVAGRWRLALLAAAFAIIHAVVAWGAVWAHYDFRYEPVASATTAAGEARSPVLYDRIPAPLRWTLQEARSARLLPVGLCDGLESLLGNDDNLGSFMRGEWRIGGRAAFFPYAIWVKTHPAIFLLLALGASAWWRARRREGTPGFRAAVPHLVLVACYLAVAMTEDINIGHRHILPIYPALYVLCGSVALLARARFGWRKFAAAALVGWLAVESLAVRPNYLAYFGPQAGGPEDGYRKLVDSSVDWGMDLPSLKEWLDERNPGGRVPVFLAYFGNDDPGHYGLSCRMMPGFYERRDFVDYRLTPGYYVISATLLQSVYTAAFGPWNRTYEELYQKTRSRIVHLRGVSATPAGLAYLNQLDDRGRVELAQEVDLFDNLRFSRLCAWLRREGGAPEQIGHSLLVWKLDGAALNAALHGPPVELAGDASTINVRRLRRLAAGPP